MGKSMLIIILGLSLVTSFLILQLNANTRRGLDVTVNYYEETQARLIANSGIEIYLEKLRQNKELEGYFPNNQLFLGDYDLTISGPDSLKVMTSVAYFSDVTHTTDVKLTREKVKVPDVNSALYISSNNIDLNLNGNVDIDGNDYRINGSPGGNPPLPGIGLDTPADSAFVINNIKPKLSEDIKGEGGAPSVRTVNDTTDWIALSKELIFSADTTLSTGTYSSGSVFGTYDDPIITVCNGDVDLTDATGYGILVVNGSINLSGNFKFYGIVIVYGESEIRCQTIGNNGIFGSTILVGESVSVESQGNSNFYYSHEAISLAKLKLRSSRFKILSWWE